MTHRDRRNRSLRPCLLTLEPRVVLALSGLTGVAFDAAGDVYLSYNSTPRNSSSAKQTVAEVGSNGDLVTSSEVTTSGSPGALATVGGTSNATLPSSPSGDFVELQPNGQLLLIDPLTVSSSSYDNLGNYAGSVNDAGVYDIQTGATTDLGSQISLSNATYGDFGIYRDALMVSGESDGWDFILRLSYGASGSPGAGTATVLVASKPGSGLSDAPEGIAVDAEGTVLATLPDGSGGAPDYVPVAFSIDEDSGVSPAPYLPTLGLTSVPDIESGGIAVDADDNFLLAVRGTSLLSGAAGIVHINDALDAFLADPPAQSPSAIPTAMAYTDAGGTAELAFVDSEANLVDTAGEISLFSGQVTPTMLRDAYGIDQIEFNGPDGTTVDGDGAGQTIAIVEEGVDPTLAQDLTTFDNYFDIPAPPNFQIVDQNNVTTTDDAIAGEASLDVEWAHAIAPAASIVVYNAAYSPANNEQVADFENLLLAMKQASEIQGVSVVTLSYGLDEDGMSEDGLSDTSFDSDFTTTGVTFLASAGDYGIYGNGGDQATANYPAASPDVIAVGGTSVTLDADGDYPGTGEDGETAWGDGADSGEDGGGGGGLSADETEPSWQQGVVPSSLDRSDARALPDVSMDSGATQDYDVFTSTLAGSSVSEDAVGWLGDAGTSASSPIWAGLIAIADQGRVLAGGSPLTGDSQTLPALYSLPSSDFHDILYGSNGDSAGAGYDLATGLGSPVANLLVPALADYDLQAADTLTITGEPPSNVTVGEIFGLTVDVQDSQGDPVSGGSVTVALGANPGDAVLGGTLTAAVVDGVATFSGLTLSQPGSGYTLTVTDGTLAPAQTTTAIDVAAGSDTTNILLSKSPSSPVYGEAVTLTATVSESGSGGTPTGSVTFTEGSSTLGTATLVNGVGQITFTPTSAGSESIAASYSGDDPSGTAGFSLTVAPASASLQLGGLSATYDGSGQAAAVATIPAGLSGVTITYTQNGVTVADPTDAGAYTVTAILDNEDYTATPVTGTLVIGKATPTIVWTSPAAINAGTPLGAGQLNAVATFDGSPLPGILGYVPAAGTVLAAGDGQTLTVIFTPSDSTDFTSATYSVPIDVVPTATPSPTPTSTPPAMIIGEQPVFRRKLKKNGKPTGPEILVGFTLTFDDALDPTAATNPANYELETVTKKKGRRVLHPIGGLRVSYDEASDSVTIAPGSSQKFPTGGQLTVLPGVSDGGLIGTTVFTITAGGKKIVP